MSDKKLFYECIDKIEDDRIIKFLHCFLDGIPEEFWTAPASTTGIGHPEENMSPGGLVRHSIQTFDVAHQLAVLYNVGSTSINCIMAASLIHDTYKNGIPWGVSRCHVHGKICSDIIHDLYRTRKQIPYYMAMEISDCVRYHMYRWCHDECETKKAITAHEDSVSVRIVQLADYFTSRKNISVITPGG